MFNWIKNFLNWPTTGIKDIAELGNYLKTNWMAFVFLLIIVLLIMWIIKTIFGWLFSLFRNNN